MVPEGNGRVGEHHDRLERIEAKIDVLIEGINQKADNEELGKLRERVAQHSTIFKIMGGAIALAAGAGALTRFIPV